MKKVLLISFMLAILVLGLPVMASEFTWSGELQYGFYNDFDVLYAPNFGNAEITTAAKVDKFNTVNLTLTASADNAPTNSSVDLASSAAADDRNFDIRFFYLSTDVSGAFGLPSEVTVKLDSGTFRPQNERYAVSEGCLERTNSFRDYVNGGMDITVGVMKLVNFEVAFDTASFAPATDGSNPRFWAGAFGGIAPIWAELYYYEYGGKPAAHYQWIGPAAKFVMEVVPKQVTVSAVANLKYNMDEETSDVDGNQYAWGVGAKADYMGMVYGVVGARGDDNNTFDWLFFEFGANYQALVGADLELVFSFGEDPNGEDDETFQMADMSAWVAMGVAKLRIGYLMYPYDALLNLNGLSDTLYCPVRTADYLAANDEPADGGLYVTMDINY